MKFVYFETYGCTANKNNTEIMKALVRQAGLDITSNVDISDIIIVNTCIVKEPTEKKIERRIQDLSNLNKPMIIAGCMPELFPDKFNTKNIYLLGTHHVKDNATFSPGCSRALDRPTRLQLAFLLDEPKSIETDLHLAC